MTEAWRQKYWEAVTPPTQLVWRVRYLRRRFISGKEGAPVNTKRSEEDRVRLSAEYPDRESLLHPCDRINERLHGLKVSAIFLLNILEEWDFKKDKFLGRYSVEYFDAAVGTIFNCIDDIEKIITKG